MSWVESLFRRLGGRRPSLDYEIDEELHFHLALRARDNRAAGMTPEAARDDARRRFGDLDRVREECREISRGEPAGELGARALKLLIWLILAGGLFLRVKGPLAQIQQVGDIIVMIAALWRLLIYARERRSAPRPALARDEHPGILGERLERLPQSFDQRGRTPVERVIDVDADGAD